MQRKTSAPQYFLPKLLISKRSLIDELYEHPRTGTGKPEPLSSDRAGQWSRRITKRHRLIYSIYENEVHVNILSAYGHYDEK
ncbi:MAG: Txe/YoeB family addiction module toxin [Prevotella sp.]|nr:Txe/YoeB family addiction module toxin [Prevotella sp.]